MELYLHLGAHRTGSTAFQRILSKNTAALGREGIAVWGPDELRPRDYFFLSTRDGFKEGAHAAYAKDLAKVKARRLVLSEENIIGTMLHNMRGRAFYPDFLRRMVDYGGMFDTVPKRIGLATREYGSYWASCYTYTLPVHPLPDFEDLKVELLKIDRGWLDMIRELRALFPKTEIMVWPLEAVQKQMTDMVSCFAGHSGAPLEDIGRRINTSRRSSVVPFVQKLRRENPGIKSPEINQHILKADLSKVAPPTFFSDEETLQLAMRYADELTALEDGFEGVRFVTRPGRCE